MATLIIDGQEAQIEDGSAIMDACEDAGVPFACRAGQSATCVITVTEGMENLAPRTQVEEDMGLADDQRLGCQAVIKNGTVVASY